MDTMKENITILGSTGTIGQNTLAIIAKHRDKYQVFAISANQNVELLERQIIKHLPKYALILDLKKAKYLKNKFHNSDTTILSDKKDLEFISIDNDVDIVMSAIVGSAALLPTLAAIKASKKVLLANKEALVMAGSLMMCEAQINNATILPIDSEHNAIFQCLPADKKNTFIDKIILTASGGPFFNKTIDDMKRANLSEATNHPTWNMGQKISIDSATMMNKALEIIEAHWLFSIPADKIKVIIHPQSIVHSMVYYRDGSVLAQMANPDMKIPIAYGLSYPQRLKSSEMFLDLTDKKFEFFAVDCVKYPSINLAYEVLQEGGTSACIMNAANEIAVDSFIEGRINLTQIYNCVKYTLDNCHFNIADDIETIIDADKQARIISKKYIQKL